jgi:HemK-like putative methylase
MCCGSGNLACGIATAIEDIHFWASDLTDETVQLTRRNIERLNLTTRVAVAQGDLFAGLTGLALKGTIDLIVCNPPYISTSRLNQDRAHLLEQEPREAFDGGAFGLSIHDRVIEDALPYLKPDRWLLFEIGLGQEKMVRHLFRRAAAYGEVQFAYDAMNLPRVAFAQKTD